MYILIAAAIAVDLLIFKTKFSLRGLVIVLAAIPVYYLRRAKSGRSPEGSRDRVDFWARFW